MHWIVKTDGCKFRVYDELTNSWSRNIGSEMHSGSSQDLEAAASVPLSGNLCIIRNNMSIIVVDVSNSGENAKHLWESLAGKGQFKTVVTNLWSGLAGRN